MLVFIVPLQSPKTSRNWALVSLLVRRTLRSILQQTCSEFHVFLICHEPPLGLPIHPALSVVQRKWSEPGVLYDSRMSDKWQKVKTGLIAARRFAPCHFMVVDADDLVSRRLAAHSAMNPNGMGWYFDEGWIHDEGSCLAFRRRHDFHLLCGTSSIVRAEPSDLPTDENDEAENCLILRSGHTMIRANCAALGTPLERLPFVGAIYIVGTGENNASFSLKTWRSTKVSIQKMCNYRPLTAGIRREFGLSNL